jgi:hypothetical protein
MNTSVVGDNYLGHAFKAEGLRQTHSLAAAIQEQFGGLHGASGEAWNILKIYPRQRIGNQRAVGFSGAAPCCHCELFRRVTQAPAGINIAGHRRMQGSLKQGHRVAVKGDQVGNAQHQGKRQDLTP